MSTEDDTHTFRSVGYYEHVIQQLDREHAELLAEVERILTGGISHATARLKNPRFSSTTLPLRGAVLRRNIVRNQEAYNAVAVTCEELKLKLHLDRMELAMVEQAQADSWHSFRERKGSGNLYDGHRAFVNKLFQYGVGNHKLLSLTDEEAEAVATYIHEVIARRHPDVDRTPSGNAVEAALEDPKAPA